MTETWKAARVGLLVVAAVAAAFISYRLVEERSAGDGGYAVWAVFDDAQGLVPKSRVLIAGISVGYIDTIRLDNAKARVDIHIDDGIVLHVDATATKRTASILGEHVLVINPGTVGRKQVEDGAQIAVARATTGTDEIMDNVGAISISVRKVAEQLERTIGSDTGGDQMASALSNLTQALEGVNRTIQSNEEVINRTLRNVEAITQTAEPRLAEILQNVETITQGIEGIVEENRGDVRETISSAGETLAAIRRAASQLEEAIGDIREVTERTADGEGTIGRLTSDSNLVDNVEEAAEGVNEFVGGIARLQTIVGLRSEYNLIANTFKSYVQLRLQPREDRYYLFELVRDPRGLTRVSQTTVTRSSDDPSSPSFEQEQRVTVTDDFRFSLVFAKRIGFATFRFGIIESTGGFGVHLQFLNDRLELNTDMFAIGEQLFPRLRSTLAYEVVQRLWLLGGVDDMMNSGTRDFYLGAMLRFNDEDLKTILPFTGSAVAGASG